MTNDLPALFRLLTDGVASFFFFFSLFLETFCDQQSFALYDGYHLVASQQEREVKLELSTNLPECLHACLQRQRCRGINYDGQSCQLLDDTSGGQILLRYGGSKGPFGIYAQKICITGRSQCARYGAPSHLYANLYGE